MEDDLQAADLPDDPKVRYYPLPYRTIAYVPILPNSNTYVAVLIANIELGFEDSCG
jgi:hypothetical protein